MRVHVLPHVHHLAQRLQVQRLLVHHVRMQRLRVFRGSQGLRCALHSQRLGGAASLAQHGCRGLVLEPASMLCCTSTTFAQRMQMQHLLVHHIRVQHQHGI